ncbi:UNVERIFIED_CONTAM: hypothetical protein RMT77_008371 [Armadillidium vulgare]
MSNDNHNQGDNSHPQVNFCPTIPFINNDPGLWLVQLEDVFPHSYNSAQKCTVVISQLPPDVLRSVRDVLSTMNDATDPYGAIKQELLQRLATPQEENIAQLLRVEDLEDRTPRQLLSRMLGLVGSPVNGQEAFLREIFLQKLPLEEQKVVAACPSSTPLQNIAEIAERVLRYPSHTPSGSYIVYSAIPQTAFLRQSATTPTPPAPPHQPTFAPLTPSQPYTCDAIAPAAVPHTGEQDCNARLSRLESSLDSIQHMLHKLILFNQQHATSFRSATPTRARARSPSGGRGYLYYYHSTFGNNAWRCNPPCSFQGNSNASQ